MTWKRLIWTAVCYLAFACATPTYGLPVISIIPEVAGGFEGDASVPIPIPDFDHTQDQPGPVMVRFNFFIEITNLAGPPDELGFSNAVLNINHDGLERATAPFPTGFICTTLSIDHDGDGGIITPPVRVPLCSDPFPSPYPLPEDDLRNILVQGPASRLGLGGVDPLLRRFGQDGPAFVGSVFLLWDGMGPDAVGTELGDPIGSYYNEEGTSFSLPPSQGVVGTVRLGQIPEPGTGILLGVGVTLLSCLRRAGRNERVDF